MSNNVEKGWDDETKNGSINLFNGCANFTFLTSLQVGKEFLGLLRPLSVNLQGREVDIMEVYKNVDFVLKGLEDSLQNIDEVPGVLYERSIQLGEFVNTAPSKPRTCA